MKKKYLLIISALLLFSCKKDNTPPYTETITKGEKWGIRIGSTPADVFGRLQQLGAEKGFNQVSIVYRQAFSRPEEIQHHLYFYNAVTLISKTGRIDRALIEFSGDKVSSIAAGGAMPVVISKWPQDVPDAFAIHTNDPVTRIYDKLLAIYQIQEYSDYQIILPEKTLSKPFDPDMVNYDEWAFSFSMNVKPGTGGLSFVRLVFKNEKLHKLIHEYKENEVFD